ncbi:MAG: vitamin K epoxide reductase family protein [Candidatus Nanopelagicales bacterium]|nr:vitamin K epoxide reductase family protein [Candidatus Nanopelagicales bacterium]
MKGIVLAATVGQVGQALTLKKMERVGKHWFVAFLESGDWVFAWVDTAGLQPGSVASLASRMLDLGDLCEEHPELSGDFISTQCRCLEEVAREPEVLLGSQLPLDKTDLLNLADGLESSAADVKDELKDHLDLPRDFEAVFSRELVNLRQAAQSGVRGQRPLSGKRFEEWVIQRSRGAHRPTVVEMLVSSVLGLVASLVLSVDALVLAENPNAQLSCNLTSKISCGAVGTSWQAHLLGFPNAFLGLMAEPIVIFLALALLMGVRFPRGLMLTAQVVTTIGFVFAYWLFYQAYFVIGALCPWCLLITVTVTLVFSSMTRINILEGNLGSTLQTRVGPSFKYGLDIVVSVLMVAVISAMVVYRYL